MTQDRPLFGIFLMLGFCMLAPAGDALAKIIGQTVPVSQLVLVRFIVQTLVLLPIVWFAGRRLRFSSRYFWPMFWRSLMHILGIGTMVTALQYLPLADAVAIAFVMPFMMLLLGSYILGEVVGPRRLAACLIGFVGTLLVIQPSFAAIGLPALWPLATAVTFSLFMLSTRQLAKEIDPISLQAVSGLIALVLLLPFLAIAEIGQIGSFQLKQLNEREWKLLLAVGLLGTFAHLLMTWSLRFAPSATLAPMQYLEIPFATLIGFLVFAEFPNPVAVIGILITITAGVSVLLFERANALQISKPLSKTARDGAAPS